MDVARNILKILVATFALMAASFLVSCSGTANEADHDSPEGVVEKFYESLGSGECDLAMQFLLFERSREIEVFIRNTASPADIQKLETEIRRMPEVETVKFVSKEEALERLRESLKGREEILDNMYGNPLHPSFEITVRDPADMETVASRFFENPIVDNTPGRHDGVKYRTTTRDSNDQMNDYTNFCDSFISNHEYEVSELKIVSSSISDTGEANVKLEVTVTIDNVVRKSDELAPTLGKFNGNWKILIDQNYTSANKPGLLALMLIEINEPSESGDAKEPAKVGPDAGMEIVPPPGP